MKRALLVTGGEAPPSALIRARLKQWAFVCAADSGMDTLLSWGLGADLAVGDFDSIRDPSALSRCREVIRHPRAKDDSDTELALDELYNRGYRIITLAGGGGGRLDHLLALRAMFERERRPCEWLTSRERAVVVKEPSDFACDPGGTVSVFPLSGASSGMKSRGLAWPLDGLVWDSGRFGLSNLCPDGRFWLDPGIGPLLVILPLESEGP